MKLVLVAVLSGLCAAVAGIGGFIRLEHPVLSMILVGSVGALAGNGVMRFVDLWWRDRC